MTTFDQKVQAILVLAHDAYKADATWVDSPWGHRTLVYYRNIEDAENMLAHCIELGYLEYFNKGGFKGYLITDAGIREAVRNPPNPIAALDTEIAALEARLTALRAQRMALEPKAGRGEMTEAGITRLIGDSLQNGE